MTRRVVSPGDYLGEVPALGTIMIGSGIMRDGESLLACHKGCVRWQAEQESLFIWVDCEAHHHYKPVVGDQVIGVVIGKQPEEYRVHLGTSTYATLPALAFDGATKRNRPRLRMGSVVFAQMALTHKYMEPHMSCCSPPGICAKDWVTNESIFGELTGGHLFDCSPWFCRHLTRTGTPFVDALGAALPLELAIGTNGRVWVRSSAALASIMARTALLCSQYVSEGDLVGLAEALLRVF